MPDYQNRLISGLFSVFVSRFFSQNNSNPIVQCFSRMFLAILIFDLNDHFAKAVAFQDGRFSKSSHFCNIKCFFF